MFITSHINLKAFNFWSGGADTAKRFSLHELTIIEDILDDLYPDGINDVQLNDLFWFDDEILCDWVGITTDELYER